MTTDHGDSDRSPRVIDFNAAAASLKQAQRAIGEVQASLQATQRGEPQADAPVSHHALRKARQIIAQRRARDRLFEPGLFGEPAWDMLLDLFVAAAEGKRVSVSSACIAAAVPPTTSLRWLAELERRQLVVRNADTADGRRVHVALSDSAARLIERLLGV